MSHDQRSTVSSPSRRALLGAGAAGALLLGGRPLALAAKKQKRIPIAVQLYSVREACAKDFDGTLAKVAELGFEGVEFAGYHQYGKDPEGLRKKLASLKLKPAGAHVGASNFMPDKLAETIAFHKALGCKFLIVPGDKRFSDPDKSKEYAAFMNETAAALKPHGLFTGHHNHTEEFKKDGEKTYWDLFAERTKKEVILQQDCGWSTVAGLDAAALVRKHPGRTKSTHVKAKIPKGTEGKKAIIGQDIADWKAIVAACAEAGGTEWLVLEQEDYPDGLSPMDAVAASLQGLKTLLGRV